MGFPDVGPHTRSRRGLWKASQPDFLLLCPRALRQFGETGYLKVVTAFSSYNRVKRGAGNEAVCHAVKRGAGNEAVCRAVKRGAGNEAVCRAVKRGAGNEAVCRAHGRK